MGVVGGADGADAGARVREPGGLGGGGAHIAQMLLAACILWTALKRRAPGMTLLRMPVLTWAEVARVPISFLVATSFIWLFTRSRRIS